MPAAATRDRVATVVTDALEQFGIDRDQITLEAPLEELDINSLDVVELGQIVREEFGVQLAPDDVTELKTVGDVVDLVASRAE